MEEEFPFKEIEKRDGRVVEFDAEKITQAIFKAARAVGGEDYQLAREVTREVIDYLAARKLPGLNPSVEEIQDVVEKVLIERGHARTAKAYILYRDKRTRIRENKSELMDAVKEILVEGNKENSFFDSASKGSFKSSPAGKMKQIAEAANKKYYLENLMPSEIAQAHQDGSFHIHSLGYYSKALESLQLDLLKMPMEKLDRSSGPGLPFGSLDRLFELAALLQKNQNDVVGEQSLLSFDSFWSFLSRLELEAPEGLITQRRALEFLSYTGRLNSLRMEDSGGINCSFHIGLDSSEEGRAVTGSLLKELIRGNKELQKGCGLVFNIKEDVNFSADTPNYDIFKLALRAALCCGKPFFSIQDVQPGSKQETKVSYFSSGRKIGFNRHGSSAGHGRGELASITLNLPRLALQTEKVNLFKVELDRLLRLGVRQLLHRFEVLTALSMEDLPGVMGRGIYEHSSLLSPGESIKKALQNGVMYISFTGLPEAVRVLAEGDWEEENKDELRLAAVIADHMGRRVSSYADEYDLNIVLSGAVDNGSLSTFTEKDRNEFGVLKGVNDKNFYSSSFILFQEDEGFDRKVELEGKIHSSCPGGYSSKILVLPGTDLHSAEDILKKLAAAGVGFVHFSPVS